MYLSFRANSSSLMRCPGQAVYKTILPCNVPAKYLLALDRRCSAGITAKRLLLHGRDTAGGDHPPTPAGDAPLSDVSLLAALPGFLLIMIITPDTVIRCGTIIVHDSTVTGPYSAFQPRAQCSRGWWTIAQSLPASTYISVVLTATYSSTLFSPWLQYHNL